MRPQNKIVESILSQMLDKDIEMVLRTPGSYLMFQHNRVHKFRPYDIIINSRQLDKVTQILNVQGLLLDKGVVNTVQGSFRFITVKRLPFLSCCASTLATGKDLPIGGILDNIAKMDKLLTPETVSVREFELSVAKNIEDQLVWLNQAFSGELHDRTADLLSSNWPASRVSCASDQCLIDCHICHGDLHAGNIYLNNGAVFVLDPSERGIGYSRVPLWADYANLGASFLLFRRLDLYNKLISFVENKYNGYNDAFFRIWTVVKGIVRVRFEKEFLSLNPDYINHPVCVWRAELIDDAYDRIKFLLENAFTRKQENVYFTDSNRTRLESLKIAKEMLEGRRSELNTKTNVYVGVSIALVAGNLSLIVKSSGTLSIANVVSLSSAAIATAVLWYLLGLIKGLPRRDSEHSNRGRSLYFSWIANERLAHVVEEFRGMSERRLSNELFTQVRSLSRNVRYRYDLQRKAVGLLTAATFLFVIGVSETSLGLIKYIYTNIIPWYKEVNNIINTIWRMLS